MAQPTSELKIAYNLGKSYETLLTLQQSLRGAILVSALYPEAKAKAQQALDDVVGADRLATTHDSPNLPYVDAFIKDPPMAALWTPWIASREYSRCRI